MDEMVIPTHPRGGSVRKQYFTSADGSVQVPATFIDDEGLDEVRKAYESYRWKDGDILLTSYPKTGTHLAWETLTMLLCGTPEYNRESKNLCSIDIFPVTKMETVCPSPRVLNTHYRLDVLPAEFRDKKTVVVLRNPKDVCVSFYHMDKSLMQLNMANIQGLQSMPISTYLNMFLFSKDMPCGSYFDYVEYMWSLRDSPNLLIVYFEDLVRDPVPTIEKVNTFMGTKRSPELVEQIADATSFDKMKQGKVHSHESKAFQELTKTDGKTLKKGTELLFRKGKIGDWREHFTVADNELFDSYLQKWTAGKDIPFKYI